MARVLKCDITGETDVPMVGVNTANEILVVGKKLKYTVQVMGDEDLHEVSERYVLGELVKLLNMRLNDHNVIEVPESSVTDNITKLE